MNPLLSVKGLTKRYGAFVGCADISFDLYPGEVMGIVGESGSGKSTLLNRMAAAEHDTLLMTSMKALPWLGNMRVFHT